MAAVAEPQWWNPTNWGLDDVPNPPPLPAATRPVWAG
jgi:hypothetical protein